MKVIEVIDKCEELLEVHHNREDLLDCFNLVQNELALNYLPLYATHTCNSNVVFYDDFKHNPVRIVGCNCKFKIYPTYIESKDTIMSVQYAYTPDVQGLYDECHYGTDVLDCLVYGIIAEYLLSQGFYEMSAMWDKKYKKQIELLML